MTSVLFMLGLIIISVGILLLSFAKVSIINLLFIKNVPHGERSKIKKLVLKSSVIIIIGVLIILILYLSS